MTASSLESQLVVGAILFALGMIGFLTRRNLILIVLSTELMLHGVSLNLTAFGRYHGNPQGQVFTIFVLTIAACEAGLALSLILTLYQRRKSLDVFLWGNLGEDDLPILSGQSTAPANEARGSECGPSAFDTGRSSPKDPVDQNLIFYRLGSSVIRRPNLFLDVTDRPKKEIDPVFDWFKPNDVLWLIPAAPLLACLWIVVVGHVVRRQYAHRPVVLALAVSFVASIYLLVNVVPPEKPAHSEEHGDHAAHAEVWKAQKTTIYQWIYVDSQPAIDVPVVLRADAMSALMLLMVTSVSLLVAIFASGYMKGDPGYPRFFASISLFVFSMCMLVLASNFLLLFVFWEAVGLCSYLLIGFWFKKPSAAAAAKKAFVVNRIGDFGFILGVFLVWTTFGTLDFETLFGNPAAIREVASQGTEIFTCISLLLFVGAVGKSAQFPLHIWLPDAMEGPTPVSALIHAATMVTAGVYLVARCTPFFVHSPKAQMVVAAIGATTALIAALTTLTQYDLKRVLAYSTVSQLGYMFMALGAAGAGKELATLAVTFAMFHMFTHAFFKAVLFLSAGSVMHSMGDVIDMRQLSVVCERRCRSHTTHSCAAPLALAGVPLLSGFWSKDEILAILHTASSTPEHGGFYRIILGVSCWLPC